MVVTNKMKMTIAMMMTIKARMVFKTFSTLEFIFLINKISSMKFPQILYTIFLC